MNHKNQLSFRVFGKYALFSNPVNRVSGEKISYQVPTYEALKGICKSIYWKPTFSWIIDEVRIIKPIQFCSQGIRPINYHGGNTLSYYTYLTDVEYQVKAHFEWNENHEELQSDRNENKHFFIAKRMLERGGRRDIFLGTRECQGYVEPCVFGSGKGYYDKVDFLDFGIMEHGFVYADECTKEEESGKLVATFWNPKMEKGVIHFIRPEECKLRAVVGKGDIKTFNRNNFSENNVVKEVGGMNELDQ